MSTRLSSSATFQCPSAGCTSSVRTPPVDFGCRNATRLSLIPVRGSSSMSCSPATAPVPGRLRCCLSGRPRGGARGRCARRNRPIAPSGSVGLSSSTCPSPTPSSTASTPNCSTVSRCWRACPAGRGRAPGRRPGRTTATPMWSIRSNTAPSVSRARCSPGRRPGCAPPSRPGVAAGAGTLLLRWREGLAGGRAAATVVGSDPAPAARIIGSASPFLFSRYACMIRSMSSRSSTSFSSSVKAKASSRVRFHPPRAARGGARGR